MPSDGPPPEDFDYGERMEDGQFENYPTIDEGEFVQEPRETYIHNDGENGCGTRTTMTGDLPASVARDPAGYSKTFCTGCGEHVPVGEVEWADGEDWVVDSESEDRDLRADGSGHSPAEVPDAIDVPADATEAERVEAAIELAEARIESGHLPIVAADVAAERLGILKRSRDIHDAVRAVREDGGGEAGE